jgi:hypothetical protein
MTTTRTRPVAHDSRLRRTIGTIAITAALGLIAAATVGASSCDISNTSDGGGSTPATTDNSGGNPTDTSAPTETPATAPPAPVTQAPTQAPVVAPAAHCFIDPEGNCYRAGEFCPKSLRGRTVQGQNGPITCRYNNGWRWEPA